MDEKIDCSNTHNEVSKETSGQEVVTEPKFRVLSPRLAAVIKESKPNPWGRGYLHLYFCCALVFLCSTMNGQSGDSTLQVLLLKLTWIPGYDGSLMGSINALHNYTTYYHLPPKGNSGTGIVFAIFNVGQMVNDHPLSPRRPCSQECTSERSSSGYPIGEDADCLSSWDAWASALAQLLQRQQRHLQSSLEDASCYLSFPRLQQLQLLSISSS
jgi:hypothetical protein